MSHVASGATDVADELAKYWTGHDLPVTSLQIVRTETGILTEQLQRLLTIGSMLNIVAMFSPVEVLRLSIVIAQAAVLHFLPVHPCSTFKRKIDK